MFFSGMFGGMFGAVFVLSIILALFFFFFALVMLVKAKELEDIVEEQRKEIFRLVKQLTKRGPGVLN